MIYTLATLADALELTASAHHAWWHWRTQRKHAADTAS